MAADPLIAMFEALTDDQVEVLAERLAPVIAPYLAKIQDAASRPEAPPSKYLTVAEAADLMRAPKQRIYDLLYGGCLTPYGTTGARLLLREEVEGYLRGEETGPTGEAIRRARARGAA